MKKVQYIKETKVYIKEQKFKILLYFGYKIECISSQYFC